MPDYCSLIKKKVWSVTKAKDHAIGSYSLPQLPKKQTSLQRLLFVLLIVGWVRSNLTLPGKSGALMLFPLAISLICKTLFEWLI